MDLRNRIILVMAVALTLANMGCTTPQTAANPPQNTPKVAKNAPEALTLTLSPGEVLSVISIDAAAGDSARLARQSYLQDALAVAGSLGLEQLGTLPVVSAAVGSFEPDIVGFYLWPRASAAAALEEDPRWPPIKARRPLGWDELRVHDIEIGQPLSVSFQPGKTYTMATAWVNPDRPDDYNQYLINIAPQVADIGGRFILDMRNPKFEAHALAGPAPDRVVFVEWDSPDGLQTLQTSPGFRDNVALLQSGTKAFELLIVGHPD